jgi:RNA polymerase sigma factor (sigma-70 family)
MKLFFRKELLQRINEGEPKAVTEVWKANKSYLISYIDEFIKNEQEADDIASETLTRMIEQRPRFDSLSRIRPYLKVIARNLCIDYFRLKQKMRLEKENAREQIESDMESLDPAQSAELYDLLMKSLEKLPGRCGKICRLHFIQGHAFGEIALELHLSMKTVRNQVTKGKKRLRHAFDNMNQVCIPLILVTGTDVFHHAARFFVNVRG